jgi:hypothetical protein
MAGPKQGPFSDEGDERHQIVWCASWPSDSVERQQSRFLLCTGHSEPGGRLLSVKYLAQFVFRGIKPVALRGSKILAGSIDVEVQH